jgi:hypothetical protein
MRSKPYHGAPHSFKAHDIPEFSRLHSSSLELRMSYSQASDPTDDILSVSNQTRRWYCSHASQLMEASRSF